MDCIGEKEVLYSMRRAKAQVRLRMRSLTWDFAFRLLGPSSYPWLRFLPKTETCFGIQFMFFLLLFLDFVKADEDHDFETSETLMI